MPLPTKITQPAADPPATPFEVQVEVQYAPAGGGGGGMTVDLVLNWPASGLDYVADSISPRGGTVDGSAGTATWTGVTVESSTPTLFDLQLSCNQSGSGPHTLTAQATGNGEVVAANPRTFNCPS